jgi:hypothetical protein
MTKVKVVNVSGLARGNLTMSKVYEVITKKDNGNYIIKNDSNVEKSFKASRFEVVNEVRTFAVGDVIKDDGNDTKSLIIHSGDLVAFADMETGDIFTGFHIVIDITAITEDEMEMIDCNCDVDDLVKVN